MVGPGRSEAPERSRVVAAVRAAWSVETCDDADVLRWSPGAPARGQCGPTALVVHDLLGGEVLLSAVTGADGADRGWHYAVRLPGGEVLDPSRAQFTAGEVVGPPRAVVRPAGLPGRCARQYVLLRERVLAELARSSGGTGRAAARDGGGADGRQPPGRPHPAR